MERADVGLTPEPWLKRPAAWAREALTTAKLVALVYGAALLGAVYGQSPIPGQRAAVLPILLGLLVVFIALFRSGLAAQLPPDERAGGRISGVVAGVSFLALVYASILWLR
jgi:hypothetical protein